MEPEHAATGSHLSADAGTARPAGPAAQAGGGMPTGKDPAAADTPIGTIDFTIALDDDGMLFD